MNRTEPVGWSDHARKLLENSCSRIGPSRLQIPQPSIYHWQGAKGTVTLATLLPEGQDPGGIGVDVAVKRVYFADSSSHRQNYNEFAQEVKILSELSHPNIVKLLGFHDNEEDRTAYLVLPWEANGNVRQFVGSVALEIPERVSLMKDVIAGIDYLHSQDPPVLHGDLKSLNILVNCSNHAVITDFGSARRLARDPSTNVPISAFERALQSVYPGSSQESFQQPRVEWFEDRDSLTLTGPGVTVRWAAPEVFFNRFDLPCDIWAFGWVCWEIMTHKLPFAEVVRDTVAMRQIIEAKLPPVRDSHEMSPIIQLCSVIQDCWEMNPNKRPDAARCKARLEWMPSLTPRTQRSEIRSPQLLLKLGDVHRLQSRPQDALKAFKTALEIALETQDDRIAAGAHLLLGYTYKDLWRSSDAESSFQAALGLYEQMADSTGAATALLGLGGVYYDGLAEVVEAEECLNRALQLFSQTKNDLGTANTLHALARIHKSQAKFDQAAENHRTAAEIYLRIGDEMGRANALLGLARVCQARSAVPVEAEAPCAAALQIYTRIGADLGRANALETLGDIFRSLSLYDAAEVCYGEAAGAYNRLRDEQGGANAVLGLARLYHLQHRYEDAVEGYEATLAMYERVGDHTGRANTLKWLAETFHAQFDLPSAEHAYAQAVDEYTRARDDIGLATTSLALAELRRSQSGILAAEDAYEVALAPAERTGNRGVQITALMQLGVAAGTRNDFASAERRFQEAVEILSELGLEPTLAVARNAAETYRKLAQQGVPS